MIYKKNSLYMVVLALLSFEIVGAASKEKVSKIKSGSFEESLSDTTTSQSDSHLVSRIAVGPSAFRSISSQPFTLSQNDHFNSLNSILSDEKEEIFDDVVFGEASNNPQLPLSELFYRWQKLTLGLFKGVVGSRLKNTEDEFFSTNPNGVNKLHCIAASGNIELLDYCFSQNPDALKNLFVPIQQGETATQEVSDPAFIGGDPGFVAIMYDKKEMLKVLCDKFSDKIFWRSEAQGWNVGHIASSWGATDCLKWLIDEDSNLMKEVVKDGYKCAGLTPYGVAHAILFLSKFAKKNCPVKDPERLLNIEKSRDLFLSKGFTLSSYEVRRVQCWNYSLEPKSFTLVQHLAPFFHSVGGILKNIDAARISHRKINISYEKDSGESEDSDDNQPNEKALYLAFQMGEPPLLPVIMSQRGKPAVAWTKEDLACFKKSHFLGETQSCEEDNEEEVSGSSTTTKKRTVTGSARKKSSLAARGMGRRKVQAAFEGIHAAKRAQIAEGDSEEELIGSDEWTTTRVQGSFQVPPFLLRKVTKSGPPKSK